MIEEGGAGRIVVQTTPVNPWNRPLTPGFFFCGITEQQAYEQSTHRGVSQAGVVHYGEDAAGRFVDVIATHGGTYTYREGETIEVVT